MKYFVYKYVYNGDIIYIGKTDDISRRIYEHASGQGLEEKFVPYLDGSDVYFHECGNEVEMSALERLLINQYKPMLNEIDVHTGISTITIEMDWQYYCVKVGTHASDIEREIMLCRRGIAANETRIANYLAEMDALQKTMHSLLPFYKYLDVNADALAQNPEGWFVINSRIAPNNNVVQIGRFTVPHWHEENCCIDGDNLLVQFTGELMQRLFMVCHRDNWIQETMNEIGENRCKIIDKRIANLRRKNSELTSKKEALERKLHEENY